MKLNSNSLPEKNMIGAVGRSGLRPSSLTLISGGGMKATSGSFKVTSFSGEGEGVWVGAEGEADFLDHLPVDGLLCGGGGADKKEKFYK